MNIVGMDDQNLFVVATLIERDFSLNNVIRLFSNEILPAANEEPSNVGGDFPLVPNSHCPLEIMDVLREPVVRSGIDLGLTPNSHKCKVRWNPLNSNLFQLGQDVLRRHSYRGVRKLTSIGDSISAILGNCRRHLANQKERVRETIMIMSSEGECGPSGLSLIASIYRYSPRGSYSRRVPRLLHEKVLCLHTNRSG